jgi:diguanylate cyclase (GGDEF)-like protein/PAS domain S-box-containing protein
MNMEPIYLNIINKLSDGVYFVDTDRRITFWSKASEEITGYKAEEIVGRRCNENLLSHIDEDGRPLCIVGCPLFATMSDGIQRKDKVFLRHKSGHRIPVIVNAFPMINEGEIVGAVEIFTLASPRYYEDDLIERLSDIAMKDSLTNLPNRRYLESFLEYKFNEFNRFHVPFAVLFADVDNFSDFNNKYGHDLGDEILKNIGATVRTTLRTTDLFGRWGGEEFVGVYAIKKETEAPILAEKIRILIQNTQVMSKEGKMLNATVSLGITVSHPDDTVKSIVERADQLMYESKRKGKNCVSFG